MTKLSLATALILGTAVFATAADDLASAFKEGKFDGRIRTQYFLTDWDMHDGTNKDATATGFAIGTKGYIGCGNRSEQGQTNDFWEFDPGCKNGPGGIDEPLNDMGWMQFSIYPNPNNGYFTIDFATSNTQENRTVEIISLDGRVLLKEIISDQENSKEIGLTDAVAGTYVLMLTSANSIKATKKFIIQ